MAKRKRITSLVLAALMMISAGGCAGSGDNTTTSEGQKESESTGKKEKVVLSCSDNTLVKLMEEKLKPFEEEINIDVEIQSGFDGWPDYWTKTMTAIAGGTAPDIVCVKETYMAELQAKGAALELSDFIEEDESLAPEDFMDAAWKTVSFDDGVYGIPWRANMICMYYNKDMLNSYGYDAPPENWDQLKEYAKTMTDESKGQYGFMWYELGTREPCFAWWYGFYLMAGGEVWKNGVPGEDFNINNQAGLDALNLQLDMIYKDKSAVGPTVQETNLAENGKVAMWMQGSWNMSQYESTMPDVNWDVALLPGYKNDAHNALVDDYAITKGSKHPEAAYKVISYLTQPENDYYFSVNTGNMPVRKATYEREELKSDEKFQVFVDAFNLEETEPKPLCEGYEELGVAVATELQKAWFGQVSAEEALAAADEAANSVLERVSS